MQQAKSVSNLAGAAPDPRLGRWIARVLTADPPRAPSLIVTVWGDALAPHGGEVWLSALIRLMAPFGINDRLVRTSVFRLARDGWLAARTEGRRSRYRLTAEGARRFADAHRRIYAPPDTTWEGEWEIVLAPPDVASAGQRAALRDALAWEGFGTFAPALHARPAHRDAPLPSVLTLAPFATSVTVMRAREVPLRDGGALAARVAAAWSLPSLARNYRRFIARFSGAAAALRGAGIALDPAQCFAVRTLLIHGYRRTLLRDPQLPAALLPPQWPGTSAYDLAHEVYRLTQQAAEHYLAATIAGDGETLPPADRSFQARFGGYA